MADQIAVLHRHVKEMTGSAKKLLLLLLAMPGQRFPIMRADHYFFNDVNCIYHVNRII